MALIKDAQKKAPQPPVAATADAPAPAASDANAEPTGDQPQADAGGEQATPEEQEIYNRCVTAGIKILYDKSTHDGIVNMLRSGDPADALAKTVATLIVQLDEKSGGKIPETVILPAAAELLDETAKLATAAKIFQVDQKTLGVAMQKLVADLGEKYGVNPDQIKSLLQSVPPDQLQSIVAEQSQYGGQAPGAPAGAPASPPAAAPPPGAPQ